MVPERRCRLAMVRLVRYADDMVLLAQRSASEGGVGNDSKVSSPLFTWW